MFKINLTGAQETVRLSDDAGILCAARDLETLADVMSGLRSDEEEDFTLNELATALSQEVIEGWFGLCDESKNEIKFDRDLITAVMSDPVVHQAFRDQYVNRLLYLREEGNGSSPSPSGTTGADETTAKRAPQNAPRARTKSKNRKPPKGAKSGA